MRLGFRVPGGGLDGGLGHVVAANGCEEIVDVRGGSEIVLAHVGPDVFDKDVPGGFHGFVGIVGIFAGHRFAPAAGAAVRLDFDQQNAAQIGDAEAGLEWRDEREMDFAESEFG